MIIHAVSIHSGGGKVLLDQLLVEKKFVHVSILLCDSRYDFPVGIESNLKIYRVKPSIFSRWKSELLLKKLSTENPDESVLCFSNLPPAFKLAGQCILFLQNALLLPKTPLYTSSYKVALRLMYEKMWLNFFWKNIDEVWVQTNWMKNALLNKGKPILIKPLLPTLPKLSSISEKKYDFITISGTASHKRLMCLLKAWSLFPVSSTPSLLVITDGLNPELKAFCRKLKNHVTVKENVSREAIFRFYEESHCLIITSKIESFCLPIYEAAHFKLKIFAPAEDYVRDSALANVLIDPLNPQKIKVAIEENYQKIFS